MTKQIYAEYTVYHMSYKSSQHFKEYEPICLSLYLHRVVQHLNLHQLIYELQIENKLTWCRLFLLVNVTYSDEQQNQDQSSAARSYQKD